MIGQIGYSTCARTPRHSVALFQAGYSVTQYRGQRLLCRAATEESVAEKGFERFSQIAESLVNRTEEWSDEEEGVREATLIEYGGEVPSTSGRPAGTKGPSRVGGAQKLRGGRQLQQVPTECLPKVAIVGRPNVGKSAMFNRLAGSSLAVVYDYPGVTRDRLYTRAFWGDKEYVLIDTGGLMRDASHLPVEQQHVTTRSTAVEGLPDAIERQAAAGVAEADTVVLLVDGQSGLQAGDREILDWLRQKHPEKSIVLAVNKCENTAKADMQVSEFWELGLTPIAVSAISGTGTGDLLDVVMSTLPPPSPFEDEAISEEPLSVAILGRPNVGKSSLLNAICGEERSIVCDLSGTTRDAVDTDVTLEDGTKLKLIDTAGIRKRTKVAGSDDGAEVLSVDRAIKSISRAQVVVMVIDGEQGVTQQDFRLSELMAGQGRAVVVVVNKWDKVDKRVWTKEKMVEDVHAQLRHVSWATVVCTTANKGESVEQVVKAIIAAGREHQRRITTATLNMVLRDAVNWKAPPTQRGSLQKGKIYYATQAAVSPPTFVFFVNDPGLIPEDYRRYMERQLRENVGFPGTPIKLLWRGKGGEKSKGSVYITGTQGGRGAGRQAGESGKKRRGAPSKSQPR